MIADAREEPAIVAVPSKASEEESVVEHEAAKPTPEKVEVK